MGKRFLIIVVLVSSMGIFNACEKSDSLVNSANEAQDQEAVTPDVYLENEYLVFKDLNAADSVIQLLSKMTIPEIELWEKSMDFNSARSEFDELFKEYERLNSYEDFLAFKSRNYEKLKFNDLDPEDNSIDYPYATIHFLPVLNNEGLIKIGSSLIKYTKNNQLLVKNGEIEALSNLQENIENGNVLICETLKSTDRKSFIVDNFPDYDPINRKNEPWHMVTGVSKRRMINELVYENYRTYRGYYNNAAHWETGSHVYFRQRAHKKRWSGWKSYTTKYYFDEMKLKVGNNGTLKFFPNSHITSRDRKTGVVKMYSSIPQKFPLFVRTQHLLHWQLE